MNQLSYVNRRAFLRNSILGAMALSPGVQLILPQNAQAVATVVIQYDWLISNGQIGDIIAVQNGYFEEAGLAVEFSPGGPNSATVPAVISNAANLGQFSETAQLFNARASGIPIKIMACGYRTGPYAFASKKSKPLRSVEDLIGLRIGVQPTARFVIEAIAAKNRIPLSELTIINVGFDKTPLLRGDVDAIGGWITNTEALSVIEDRVDLLASDLGMLAYANVYFATDSAIENNSEALAAFVAAVAKGWGWTHANPEEAVRKSVAAYPSLNLEWELKTIDLILSMNFDENTQREGWGTFSTDNLEAQLSLFDEIGQYPDGRPKLSDVYTSKILKMTAQQRPKLG